jgi:hypothetical protein
LQVQGIPPLLLFVRGELKWRTTGAIPYAQMKQEVFKAIG